MGLKFNEKRGLSDVISTVLIILLVLSAVVIVWVFVRQAIQNSGERINADCLTTEVEPVSCTNASASGANVIYKYARGDVAITGVKLIFVASDGSTEVKSAVDVPGKFETKTDVRSDLGVLPVKLKTAAVVTTASSNEMICPESTIVVDCVAAP